MAVEVVPGLSPEQQAFLASLPADPVERRKRARDELARIEQEAYAAAIARLKADPYRMALEVAFWQAVQEEARLPRG